MGNALYPVLPGLKWDVIRRADYNTKVQLATSGARLSGSFYSAPLRTWTMTYDILRQSGTFTELDTIANFFSSRAGRFDSFLFEDPEDKTVTDMGFGLGDSTKVAFQLQRVALGSAIRNALAPAGAITRTTTPRRNLITNTEDDSFWTSQNGGTGAAVYVLANYGMAPDGTQTADRMVLNINSGTTGSDYSQAVVGAFECQIGKPYTLSLWARSISGNRLVHIGDNSGTNIVQVTSVWKRFTKTFTGFYNPGYMTINLFGSTGTDKYADILVWGAQLENGLVATEYMPNSATTPFVSPAYWPASADGFEPIYNLNQTISPVAITLVDPMQNKWLLGSETHVNFVLQSAAFDNAAWTLNNATISANAIAAPDGTVTADMMTNNATSGEHRIFQGIATNNYAQSVFAKAGTASFLAISNGGPSNYAMFNLTLGTVVATAGGVTGTITPVGNGWYRCATNQFSTSYTVLNMGETQAQAVPGALTVGTSKTIYLWGAHSDVATAIGWYIPTTTGTNSVPDYTVSSSGVVTFTVAPFTGWALTWTGSYYWRVCFKLDSQETDNFLYKLYALKKVELETSR